VRELQAVAVPTQPVARSLDEIATFSLTTAKARFGVAYVKAIATQAGVGMSETPPDEDVLAVDATLDFNVAPVRIQIKCTSQFKIDGASATWPARDHWRENWTRSRIPVYFVLVILDRLERPDWISHSHRVTSLHAAAFWTRVNDLGEADNIVIPKSNKLTAETLCVWEEELMSCLRPRTEG
jgi:hypothetical protein